MGMKSIGDNRKMVDGGGRERELGWYLNWNIHTHGNSNHDLCPKNKEYIIKE
jgi:hypothetical protein